jgi:catechol 2,3-dioxygenase
VRIGHVHLKVADLERALEFYCGVLEFETTDRFGREAAFVSNRGCHHHIGINTWESLGGSPAPPGTGIIKAGITLDGASDHGVSEALYLRDPDQNGVELYWDRPREQSPHLLDGRLTKFTRALDLDSLPAEAKCRRGN